MKVHFQITYCTVWGEEVRVKIGKKDGEEVIHPLSTSDGKIWKGMVEVSGDISYQYCIYNNNTFSRAEWDICSHRLADGGKQRIFYLYDAWRNKSDMSYFYSSAFTDCVRGIEQTAKSAKKQSYFKRSLVLQVPVPQLERGQRLAVCGNQEALGNWNTEKGVMLQRSKELLHWSVQLDASSLTFPLEYKYYSVDEETGAFIDWESGLNRLITAFDIHENEVYVISDNDALFSRPRWKGAGVAIPVFSLKTKESFGVGDFEDLKRMIDWAALTHQRVVQILPINDTTMTHKWTDSYPYSSISIFALHPMYMNLKNLGTLRDKQQASSFEQMQRELNSLPQIDYEAVYTAKWSYILQMFKQEGTAVLSSAKFKKFFAENESWLMPYAAFSYLRDKFGTPDFNKWKGYEVYYKQKITEMCAPESPLYPDIAIYYYVQYNLHIQLLEASTYARKHHVILKGDIPIGISRNSVEAWIEPYYFNMNGQAGAPPDDFSVKGQNWGFPTYNWDEMAKDGYKWWKRRFEQMSLYFDAYRIDHILGFFRIWEIPTDSVHGLLGQFVPSMPLSIDEIQSYGLWFRRDFFTRPYINDTIVGKVFGPHAAEVKKMYLRPINDGLYEMLPAFDTQRKVEAAFDGKTDKDSLWIRDGLYSLISDVLFVADRKDKNMFHPRIAVQFDFVYDALGWKEKEAFNQLYNDYYYRRHNQFWYHEAMKKLPCLIGATRMLVCGEDLGMVPDCVGTVMNELQILSLELQRMPKCPKNEFGHVNEYPYLSVCTFSSHDTSTIRGWWEEDLGKTARFFQSELHQQGNIPSSAPAWACKLIVNQQLSSTSMLAILSFQDWLSMDENVRFPDVQAERINVPANPHHYWRYRIHLTLEELLKCDALNEQIRQMIDNSGRYLK